MIETAATDVPRRGRDASRERATPRGVAVVLMLYVSVRAFGVLALACWDRSSGTSAHHLLAERWDSLWYARVAEHGYGYTVRLPDGAVHSDLAFFPLLPWLERLVSALTTLSPADAGLLVSGVGSVAAAWGIHAVGDLLFGPRVGALLTLLWAVVPVGVVQSMAYTESLFCALAAWGVYAALTGRWLWAGTLAALAGLTRPVGAAVVAAIWLPAALRLCGRAEPVTGETAGGTTLTGPAEDAAPGRLGWRGRLEPRLLIGALIAPLGWLGYVVWVGWRTGDPLGYLTVQSGWDNGFDGGWAFARFVSGLLAGPSFLAGLGLVAAVALVVWSGVRCWRLRLPAAVIAYGAVATLLAMAASGYFGSKPRLLLPAFPLLLPVAVALARLRPVLSGLILAVVACGSAGYGAFWLHGSGPP